MISNKVNICTVVSTNGHVSYGHTIRTVQHIYNRIDHRRSASDRTNVFDACDLVANKLKHFNVAA